MQEYFDSNKDLWNAKVPVHIDSKMYNMEGFMAGETSLDEATLALLGNIEDKTVLHLQCHFGQDSLSMSRMGAKVTGMDISDEAIKKARSLNSELGLNATFVESNVYDLKENLEGKFDIVFASYGTIVWLPDLDKWADIINHFMKPGGRFVFLDFHPVLDMLDWNTAEMDYNYFNSKKPYMEVESGTYADTGADINMKEYFWTHSLAEVITALNQLGLQMNSFIEYDYSPYNIFGEMEEVTENRFKMKKIKVLFPYMYSLVYKKS